MDNYFSFFLGLLVGILLGWMLFTQNNKTEINPWSVDTNPYGVPPKSANILDVMNYLAQTRNFTHLDGSLFTTQEKNLIATMPGAPQCYQEFMKFRDGYYEYVGVSCAGPNTYAIVYDEAASNWDLKRI